MTLSVNDLMSSPRILVIEDNSADIALLRHGLDQHGEPYELRILQDGEEALHFIEGQRSGGPSPQPCVIVLDLHLPRHSGLEILKALRLEPVLSHIAVVVLTTLARPVDQAEIHLLGANLRVKPTQIAEYRDLATLIFELCKKHTVAAA